MAIPVETGEYIPMLVVIDTEEEDLDISARLVNRVTLAVVADNVPLTFQAGTPGEYVNNDEVEMPEADFVDCIYTILDSSGNLLRKAGELFVNKEVYGGGGGTSTPPGGDVEATIIDNDSFVGIVQICA